MTKATTKKSMLLSVRVPNELYDRVLARCDREVAPVGAIVNGLLATGLDAVDEIAGLKKAIETKDAEIDRLTKQLKPVAALKLPVLTEAPKRETYLRGQAPEKGKTKTR